MKKTSSKATSKKTSSKPRAKVVKSTGKKAASKADVIDQVLLRLAARPYGKIMKQIEAGRKRLDSERRMALELGSRILSKAKEVRDSLIQRTRAARGE